MHSLLALLIVGLASQDDPLARPITFSYAPARADIVLSELSKASGIQLLTSQVTAKELLVVHVKNAPLKTLMQKIAAATSCEWQSEKEAYRLVRKPAVEAAEKQ